MTTDNDNLIGRILKAATIFPCHVTGMHDPTHTQKYICDMQKANAYDRIMAQLEVESPRSLHSKNCYWCHSNLKSKQSKELRKWAKYKSKGERKP
jgi:hypothetical protein